MKKFMKGFLSALTVFVSILLVLIMVFNITIIYKSTVNPSEPADFMGYIPLVIEDNKTSDSSQFQNNDLVIFEKKANNDFKVNDVVCYWKGYDIVTQTIKEINKEENTYILGEPDNNFADYKISGDAIIGSYKTHVTGIGKFILSSSSSSGMVICIVIIIVILSLTKLIESRNTNKDKKDSDEQKDQEIDSEKE